MKKTTVSKLLQKYLPYVIVIAAFVVCQYKIAMGDMPRTTKSLLIPVCVYIVMAVSLNLTVGISGELSLGHAGFMSIGAFTGIVIAAYTREAFGMSETAQLVFAIAAGGVLAGIAGFLIGIPVLRLQGDYLAIVTLAFGEIIRNILNCVYISIDGTALRFSFNRPDLPGKLLFRGPTGATGVSRIATFTAGFILVLFTLFVVLNLVHSRSGRAIMAVRDNKIAAEACGLDVTKYRMMAFVTSAALAGMGGALFGQNYSTLTPANFSFNASILILVYVVLGGIGNITGSIIAATVLYVLPETPKFRAFADYRMLVYAVVLITVMLLINNGAIKSFLETLWEKVRGYLEKKGGELHE